MKIKRSQLNNLIETLLLERLEDVDFGKDRKVKKTRKQKKQDKITKKRAKRDKRYKDNKDPSSRQIHKQDIRKRKEELQDIRAMYKQKTKHSSGDNYDVPYDEKTPKAGDQKGATKSVPHEAFEHYQQLLSGKGSLFPQILFDKEYAYHEQLKEIYKKFKDIGRSLIANDLDSAMTLTQEAYNYYTDEIYAKISKELSDDDYLKDEYGGDQNSKILNNIFHNLILLFSSYVEEEIDAIDDDEKEEEQLYSRSSEKIGSDAIKDLEEYERNEKISKLQASDDSKENVNVIQQIIKHDNPSGKWNDTQTQEKWQSYLSDEATIAKIKKLVASKTETTLQESNYIFESLKTRKLNLIMEITEEELVKAIKDGKGNATLLASALGYTADTKGVTQMLIDIENVDKEYVASQQDNKGATKTNVKQLTQSDQKVQNVNNNLKQLTAESLKPVKQLLNNMKDMQFLITSYDKPKMLSDDIIEDIINIIGKDYDFWVKHRTQYDIAMAGNYLFLSNKFTNNPEGLGKKWAAAIFSNIVEFGIEGDTDEWLGYFSRFNNFKVSSKKDNIGKMHTGNKFHNLLNFNKEALGNPSVMTHGRKYNDLTAFFNDNPKAIGTLFLDTNWSSDDYQWAYGINFLQIKPDELKNFGWDKSGFLYYDGPALLGNFKIGGFKSPEGSKIVYSGDDLLTPEELMKKLKQNIRIT